MKYISLLAFLTMLLCTFACEKIEEEPEIKSGYDDKVRVPDAEEATDADKAVIQDQKDEYTQNAK